MATIAGSGCVFSQRLSPKLRKSKTKAKSFRDMPDSEFASMLSAGDGIAAYACDPILENMDRINAGREALDKLSLLLSKPPKSVYKQLQAFRKYARDALEYQLFYQDMIETCNREMERLINGMSDRSGRRWTEIEDETLVDYASMDGYSVVDIALMLGRTPGAVQTRLSYLVGIKRVSAKVAGKFVGWFNGEEVEGSIDGVVTTSQREG